MKYHLCRSPKSKPHIPNFQAKPHGFTLIEFMPEMKADKVLQDKLAERENIKVILNSVTKEVIGKEFVESIKYVDRATNEEQ